MESIVSKKALRHFHRRLHRWYAAHGRKELPWRKTADAYAVYVSEIMLQQTQVGTVLERYYFPFLARFPTLPALAGAGREEVLKAWQGLGYYNRALNLHKTAALCKGALPDTAEGLMALPGVGRNTAHAVAAFAHRRPVAVMEANVRRVLARIFALSAPSESTLWEKAAQLLDTANPFDYNQAMMDLGALVCTKRSPACSSCPADFFCRGKDAPHAYPVPKLKSSPPVRRKKIVVLRDVQDRYYAAPREGRFLKGLYHFAETEPEARQLFIENTAYDLTKAQRIGTIRQQYSHFTLEADVWLMAAGQAAGNGWYTPEQLRALPVSMAEHKTFTLLCFT